MAILAMPLLTMATLTTTYYLLPTTYYLRTTQCSLAHELHVLGRLGAHRGELGDENVAEEVELGRLAVMHAQLL